MNDIVLTAPIVITLVIAWLGGVLTFGKILLAQFEKRVEAQFEAAARVREQQHETLSKEFAAERERTTQLHKDFQDVCRDLPLAYVRREDWIRFSSQIDHKLDKLADLVIKSGNNSNA